MQRGTWSGILAVMIPYIRFLQLIYPFTGFGLSKFYRPLQDLTASYGICTIHLSICPLRIQFRLFIKIRLHPPLRPGYAGKLYSEIISKRGNVFATVNHTNGSEGEDIKRRITKTA